MSFQDRLQQKTNEAREKPAKDSSIFPPSEQKKLTKKQKLIEDFITVKLEYMEKYEPNKLGEFKEQLEKFPDAVRKRINKIKVAELEDQLAQLFSKLANAPSKEQACAGAEALFQMTAVLINGVEQISIIGDSILDQQYEQSGTEKNHTLSLHGLTSDTFEQEELIKPILAEIYEEYKESIDAYLTPWARLSMVFTNMTLARLSKNNVNYQPKNKKYNNIPEETDPTEDV